MKQHIATLAVLVTAACLPPAQPAARDPSMHGRYALAFSAAGEQIAFLERREGDDKPLTLVRLDITRGELTRAPLDDASLNAALQNPWPARAELSRLVRESASGRALAAEGYRWGEPSDDERLETRFGVLSLDDGDIRLTVEGIHVTVQRLPPSVRPSAWRWIRDPAQHAAVIEVAYEGSPSVLSPYVIIFAPAAARLASARAYAAYLREQWTDALALWQLSAELDPTVGETLYNVACMHAILGRNDLAALALRQAHVLGGRDFASLARTDPDLESLRLSGELDAVFAR